MSEIEIEEGQIWDHNSGDFSAEVISVCYEDDEVCLKYLDNEEEVWLTSHEFRTDYSLVKEHSLTSTSVDDAEAAFKASMAEELPEVTELPKAMSIEEAEALFSGEEPVSTLDQAEENFKKSVDYPLAQVESPKISAKNVEYTNLLVLGII